MRGKSNLKKALGQALGQKLDTIKKAYIEGSYKNYDRETFEKRIIQSPWGDLRPILPDILCYWRTEIIYRPESEIDLPEPISEEFPTNYIVILYEEGDP